MNKTFVFLMTLFVLITTHIECKGAKLVEINESEKIYVDTDNIHIENKSIWIHSNGMTVCKGFAC